MKIEINNRFNGSVIYTGEGVDLKEVVVKAVSEGVSLYRADLSEVDLRGADLSEADLSEASLFKTGLWGANLYGADLRRTNLRGADLRGVKNLPWKPIFMG